MDVGNEEEGGSRGGPVNGEHRGVGGPGENGGPGPDRRDRPPSNLSSSSRSTPSLKHKEGDKPGTPGSKPSTPNDGPPGQKAPTPPRGPPHGPPGMPGAGPYPYPGLGVRPPGDPLVFPPGGAHAPGGYPPRPPMVSNFYLNYGNVYSYGENGNILFSLNSQFYFILNMVIYILTNLNANQSIVTEYSV